MAKRFTDTEKWEKRWLRKLGGKFQLFWHFINDRCNHAGIWDVDMESFEFHTGWKLTRKETLEAFNRKIFKIKEDKWFIPKFVEFQYGRYLNPESNVHRSVRKCLDKYDLINGNFIKPLTNPSPRVKDKDKAKIKVKDKRKELNNINIDFDFFWDAYDYKKDIYRCELLWRGERKLSDGSFMKEEDRESVMDNVPFYVEATPEKRYRKNPSTYLYNKLWLDEIVERKQEENDKIRLSDFKINTTGHYIGYCEECSVSDFYDKWELREDSRCCKARISAEK